MSELNNYKLLCDMIDTLKSVDITTTNHVSKIRKFVKQINEIKSDFLDGLRDLTDGDVAELQLTVDAIVEGREVELTFDIETEHTLEMFQLGVSPDNVILEFEENFSGVADENRGRGANDLIRYYNRNR